MKQNFKRVVAFIMAVLMLLTMQGWDGLAEWTVTTAKAADTITVYFYNGTTWADPILNAWGSGTATSNISMSNTEGDWWSYDVPDGQTYVKVEESGNSANAYQISNLQDYKSAREVYLVVTADGNQTFASKAAAELYLSSAPGIRVHFYNGKNWGTVDLYSYNDGGQHGSWPGEGMAFEGNNWYVSAVESGASYIINNGNNGTQTTDLTAGDSDVYLVYDGERDADNKAVVMAFASKEAADAYLDPGACRVYFYNGTNLTDVHMWAWPNDTVTDFSQSRALVPIGETNWYVTGGVGTGVTYIQIFGTENSAEADRYLYSGLDATSDIYLVKRADGKQKAFTSKAEAEAFLNPDNYVTYYFYNGTGLTNIRMYDWPDADMVWENRWTFSQVDDWSSTDWDDSWNDIWNTDWDDNWYVVHNIPAGVTNAYVMGDQNTHPESARYSWWGGGLSTVEAGGSVYLVQYDDMTTRGYGTKEGAVRAIAAYQEQSATDVYYYAAGNTGLTATADPYREITTERTAGYEDPNDPEAVNGRELHQYEAPVALSETGDGWYHYQADQAVTPGMIEINVTDGTGTYHFDVSNNTQKSIYLVRRTDGKVAAFYTRTDADNYINQVASGFQAHYYAGTEQTADADGRELTTGWSSVYADIYYYAANGESSTARTYLATSVPCTPNAGNPGWFDVDLMYDPGSGAFIDGIYVEFNNGTKDGTNAVRAHANSTAAYQLTNAQRTWCTSQMTQFRNAANAQKALTGALNQVDPIPAGSVRIWFFTSDGDTYTLHHGAAEGTINATTSLVEQTPYTEGTNKWYYATVPVADAKYIYFSHGEDDGAIYNLSDNAADEIFCVYDKSKIPEGWSVSATEIAYQYGAGKAPSSSEIRLPVSILDYDSDNLFFEYDTTYLRSMTMVLRNAFGEDRSSSIGDVDVTGDTTNTATVSEGRWAGQQFPVLDGSAGPLGNDGTIRYDRNDKAYAYGLLEEELNNGYPVYTEAAVTYIAKIAAKAFDYYRDGHETDEEYVKTDLFKRIYNQVTQNGTTAAELGTYEVSADKTFASIADVATCMDYAYYVMNNLYNANSTYNSDYDLYDYLILKKTSDNTYGFYANFATNEATSYNLIQNYGKDGILYDTTNKTISNDTSQTEVTQDGEDFGYQGFLPYNPSILEGKWGTEVSDDRTFAALKNSDTGVNDYGKYYFRTYNNGKTVEYTGYPNYYRYFEKDAQVADPSYEYKELRNYGYTMKSSGQFLYDSSKDLYFTFTGDDDVALYINNKKVLDLGGAHEAASYTVYLNDLVDFEGVDMVDGRYYNFDFFYMERHTSYANLRIQTNIDVIQADALVEKRAYTIAGSVLTDSAHTPADWTKDTVLTSGTSKISGTPIVYEFALTASQAQGLTNLVFEDESLGFKVSYDGTVDLGTYEVIKVDEHGEVILNESTHQPETEAVERKLSDLTVVVDGVPHNFTDDQAGKDALKTLLTTGIEAGQTIEISGVRHVLNAEIGGAVKAEMLSSEADGSGLPIQMTRHASNVLYVSAPDIEVTQTVKPAGAIGESLNYADGTTLQEGTLAEYTLVLQNTDTASVTGLTLTDDTLGIAFGQTPALTDDAAAYVSADTPITITVAGTGVADGSYTATSVEEYNAIAAKLAKLVYPQDASVTISGIRHVIDEKTDSVVTGTAQYLEGYDEETNVANHKTWAAYAAAYRAYLDSTEADKTEPVLNDYVIIPLGRENTYGEYQAQVKALVQAVKAAEVIDGEGHVTTPGLQGVDIAAIPDATTYFATGTVTDDAEVTLYAEQSDRVYYTQAKQEISFIQVQDETVVTLPHGTTGAWGRDAKQTVEVGTYTLTGEDTYLTVYNSITNGTGAAGSQNGYGFNLWAVELYQTGQAEPVKTLVPAENTTILGGTAVQTDGALPLEHGQGVTLPLNGLTAGDYTVKLVYVNGQEAANEVKASVVVDGPLPGNYVFATATSTTTGEGEGAVTVTTYEKKTGAEATTVTIGSGNTQVTYTIDNADIYPNISYTANKTGTEVFYLLPEASTAGARANSVTVYTYGVNDDVYVLDYGLDVSLTATDGANDNGLFTNDTLKIDGNDGTVAAFFGMQHVDTKVAFDQDHVMYQNDTYEVGEDAFTEKEGAYGKVKYKGSDVLAEDADATDTEVTYQLNKFLEGLDRYTYAAQVYEENVAAANRDETNSTPVMEANVTIMPASIVYYEDNFTASITTNGTVTGEAEEELQNNSLQVQYGYDDAYKADTQGSNGTYTALAGNQSIAFTFYGTGFDILTRTSNANLYVAVYDAADYGLTSYTYSGGTMYYAVKQNADASGPIKTAYINAYNENQMIHHIPLISMDLGAFKRYLVVATKTTGTDALYVDGIRIYNPLGTKATVKADAEQSAAYSNAEGELDAVVLDIRSTILGADYKFEIGAAQDPTRYVDKEEQEKEIAAPVASLAKFEGNLLYLTQGSTVVESYTGSIDSGEIAKLDNGEDDTMDKGDNTSSLLAYAVSGPNNELYLTDEQYVYATVLDGDLTNATVQLGMKAVQGQIDVEYLSNDTTTVTDPETGDETTEYVWKSLVSGLESATEMYYKVDLSDLKVADGKKVLVVRAKNADTGDYILSMTNLKYSSSVITLTRPSAGDLVATETAEEDETYAGVFEVLSNTSGSKKSVVTISVPGEVTEFTVVQKGAEGSEDTTILTYTEARGPRYAVDGVKLSYRETSDGKIFVLQFTNQALKGHTFQTTTLAQKTDDNGNTYYYKNATFDLN